MTKANDLTGRKYGRLTAVSRAKNTEHGRAQWLCRCDCGGERIAQAAYLNRGSTRSCGCLGIEQRKSAAQSQCHDAAKRQHPREYSSWANMLARCYDKRRDDFKWYGGIGIVVCARWRDSFSAFLADMGPRPFGMTLDRRVTSADYSPDNCRWATATEQANNRRDNHRITIDGVTRTIAEWSRQTGVGEKVISARICRGWDARRAVETQVR